MIRKIKKASPKLKTTEYNSKMNKNQIIIKRYKYKIKNKTKTKTKKTLRNNKHYLKISNKRRLIHIQIKLTKICLWMRRCKY